MSLPPIDLDIEAVKEAVNRDPRKKSEITERLGSTRSAISRKLAGQRKLEAWELLTICDSLGIENPKVFSKDAK